MTCNMYALRTFFWCSLSSPRHFSCGEELVYCCGNAHITSIDILGLLSVSYRYWIVIQHFFSYELQFHYDPMDESKHQSGFVGMENLGCICYHFLDYFCSLQLTNSQPRDCIYFGRIYFLILFGWKKDLFDGKEISEMSLVLHPATALRHPSGARCHPLRGPAATREQCFF